MLRCHWNPYQNEAPVILIVPSIFKPCEGPDISIWVCPVCQAAYSQIQSYRGLDYASTIFIQTVTVSHDLPYFAVFAELNVSKPCQHPVTIVHKNIRGIDCAAFQDITHILSQHSDLSVASYNAKLLTLMDCHELASTRKVQTNRSALGSPAQWPRGAKREWHLCRARLRKSGLTSASSDLPRMLLQITSSKPNQSFIPRKFWPVSCKIFFFCKCFALKTFLLPTNLQLFQMPNAFKDYFASKIEDRREKLDSVKKPTCPCSTSHWITHDLFPACLWRESYSQNLPISHVNLISFHHLCYLNAQIHFSHFSHLWSTNPCPQAFSPPTSKRPL